MQSQDVAWTKSMNSGTGVSFTGDCFNQWDKAAVKIRARASKNSKVMYVVNEILKSSDTSTFLVYSRCVPWGLVVFEFPNKPALTHVRLPESPTSPAPLWNFGALELWSFGTLERALTLCTHSAHAAASAF